MESIADFGKWIETMRLELGQQKIAAESLAIAFTEGNRQLIRRDQVNHLRFHRFRILEEVENLKRTELAAQKGATKGALLSGVAAFTIGSLFAAFKGRQDAYNIGAKMASSAMGKEIPFDTILIMIGKRGIPKGVKVVSISHLARESSRSESAIEADLKRKGCLLMTVERYFELMDKVEQAILDGSTCLPLKRSEVKKQLTG